MSEAVVRPLGLHHGAVVVSDLDRTVEFYRRCFGAVVEMALDGLTEDAVAAMQGLPEIDMRLAYLRMGEARVELLEYCRPEERGTQPPSPCDVGSSHVALAVADVHGAYHRLREVGVHFDAPPVDIHEGPAAGWVIAYCHDPDGNRIELLQTL